MEFELKAYNLSRQSELGNLFKIGRDNQYCFRKGLYQDVSIRILFENFGEKLIENLKSQFNDSNLIDKKVILEIIEELESRD